MVYDRILATKFAKVLKQMLGEGTDTVAIGNDADESSHDMASAAEYDITADTADSGSVDTVQEEQEGGETSRSGEPMFSGFSFNLFVRVSVSVFSVCLLYCPWLYAFE